MLVKIDPTSRVPLSDQVASSVRRAMAEGQLRSGDRLPAAREVAKSLGVNVHTVLRGYQALKAEGLIDLRPGRGAVVITTAPRSHALLIETFNQAVALARELGFSDEETLSAFTNCLSTTPTSVSPAH
ncbi:GntR family transcriptional regulator [Streptomyces paludis]|uniref:GntR family transcriptional regulator n=1 Tax=Streptomyces paludis TaxID=2282738 RepID=A0A345HUJ7_9ACTN|nr:GntR family transcriptional regulator [Streptomyces paludis]AXG80371.1 GntR family transcriptional regulator [Streptomyces paludis]